MRLVPMAPWEPDPYGALKEPDAADAYDSLKGPDAAGACDSSKEPNGLVPVIHRRDLF